MKPTVLPFILLILGACDDKKSQSTSRSDGGAQTKISNVDPKIEKALATATSASPAQGDGPPPQGVFASGAADKLRAKGAPPKVEVGSEGAEPRVAVGVELTGDAGGAKMPKGAGKLVLATSMGRTARPTMEYLLSFGPGKKEDEKSWLVLLQKAAPAQEQLGKLPEGMDKEIAKLSGTEIVFPFSPSGEVGTGTLRTKAAGDLTSLADTAREILELLVVVPPGKKVGVGAYWMVEARSAWAGADVLVYRAYKVKSVDKDAVTLQVDVKMYAASTKVELPGLPKGAVLEQYESIAQSELTVAASDLLPMRAEMVARTVMLFPSDAAPPPPPMGTVQDNKPQKGMLPVMLQTEAKFAQAGAVKGAP